jgi:hypothetical protein
VPVSGRGQASRPNSGLPATCCGPSVVGRKSIMLSVELASQALRVLLAVIKGIPCWSSSALTREQLEDALCAPFAAIEGRSGGGTSELTDLRLHDALPAPFAMTGGTRPDPRQVGQHTLRNPGRRRGAGLGHGYRDRPECNVLTWCTRRCRQLRWPNLPLRCSARSASQRFHGKN